MGDARRVREAFDAANDFLTPILQREEIQKNRGSSLLEILSKTLPVSTPDDGSVRNVVIGKALELLTSIHLGFTSPVDDAESSIPTSSGYEDAALEDAKRRRMLHALLDLISLEGIYPSLSSGVGIPLQERVISVLPAGVIAKQPQTPSSSTPQDEFLLDRVLKALLNILFDVEPSIQPVIRGRILSDLISGTSDLAFNSPNLSIEERKYYRDSLTKIIDNTPNPVLLPTLSSFLRADTAPWFKSAVSSQISRVPLRQDGVLQTIFFIASQFSPALGQEAQTQPSNGPHFTVQAIMQMSRLLSSVPQDMDASLYFTTIAPQLLALIDGDDPDLRRTAAYVVGNGILGKRAYGAAGTVGHSIFVEPIFKALTAEADTSSRQWMKRFADSLDTNLPSAKEPSQGNILVAESTVLLAVDRLASLTLQHPNPGLVKRLIYPILLPLWGLACYTLEQQITALHENVMKLLQTYFSISVGEQPLKKLADNLLWDGGPTWTYTTGATGGVSLRKRGIAENDRFNYIQLMDRLEARAGLFVKLLGSDPRSEERTGDIFLHVSAAWLVQSSIQRTPGNQLRIMEENDDSEKIIHKLVSAKLAEKLLDNFKDTLSRRPLRVLELVKQVINGELGRVDAKRSKIKDRESGKVSLSSLANIVTGEDEEQQNGQLEKDSAESLSAIFSLLSTVLASPEFSASEDIVSTLEGIKVQLDQLIPYLPSSLSIPGTTASMLLEIHLTSPEGQEEEEEAITSKPSHAADLEIHRQALTNLNSDLPPVQAEGLSLLSDLIKKSSPVLDIPATLFLLLSIITDPVSESASNEEFIYLNAIKLIGTLASRHPRTVVKTLVERYADKNEEKTLDQRLKLGESLLRTVQDLGEALAGETAKILGEGMIAIAGRRGRKPQTQKARKHQLEEEQRQKEREKNRKQREFSSSPMCTSFPTPDADLDDADSDSETETAEQAAHSANVLAAWAAGASSDEEPDDLRVRASALSILASAVQTNLLGLGSTIAGSAVDLALSTLTLEANPESAILRRASVVLLLDILKALDTARETRSSSNALGFGFSLADDDDAGRNVDAAAGPATIGNLPHMLRTLQFVESRETDSIVRGHIRVLIESLEAWMEKSLLWGIGARGEDGQLAEPRLELGDRIAGLRIDPLSGRRDAVGRPKIEEIE